MGFVILFAIINCLVCIVAFLKLKKNAIFKYIVFIWAVSSLFSILFYYESNKYLNITLFPYLFLLLCFFISILPFYYFDDNRLKKITIGNSLFFKMTVWGLAIISFLPFCENMIHLVSSFSLDNSSALADVYEDKMSGDFDKDKLVTWFSSIGKFFNSINLKFSYASLFILFMYLTNKKINKYILIGLIMACANPVLYSLGLSARSGIVFTSLNAVFYFLLFRNLISAKIKSNIRIVGLVLLSIAGFGFIIMTMARYMSNDSHQTVSFLGWISLYLGEGTLNFNELMWNTGAYTMGDNSFSFFKSVLGFDTFTDLFERRSFWSVRTGIPGSIFYTFIGDIFSDIGFWTVAFCSIISFILMKKIKNKDSVSILALFAFSIWGILCIGGFTCYIFKTHSNILDLLFSYFIIIILNIRLHNGKKKSTSHSVLPASVPPDCGK